MFSAGTRVSVHSSNVSGKKLGPKQHSLGYVNVSKQAYFIKAADGFPIKGQSFVVNPMVIMFTRYGREQRSRAELRSFMNVMPVFMDSKGIEIHQRIKEVLNLCIAGEFANNGWWAHIRQNYGTDYAGILLPVRSYKAARMDHSEVETWASAIIRNQEFGFVLQRNRNLPTFKALYTTYPKLFMWVAKAASSSDSRYSLFSWTRESKDNLNHFVTFMRIISSCINKRQVETSITSMAQHLESQPNGIKTDTFVTWFTNNMFDGERIMSRKHTIANAAGVNHHLKDLTDCMRVVRSTFLNIKPKYV